MQIFYGDLLIEKVIMRMKPIHLVNSINSEGRRFL